MKYDYLIVGSGLFGCVFAERAKNNGKKCLIIEKRNHPFGNCYTENIHGIEVHKYGPHIFHTNSKKIWDYVNQFGEFNNFINKPKILFNNTIFSFPINLMTLHQLWGVTNPSDAIKKLEQVRIKIDNPKNLEEWVLSQVGIEIYEKFIKGYTKKQWGTDPKNLPSFIIKRLPIRTTFDENYYFDKYQGIPINGYSSLIKNMVDSIPIELNTDYFDKRDYYDSIANKIVFTGPIDEFFEYSCGVLDYRSLEFHTEKKDICDFQGNAIINYTEESVPFTRIIEHKHFNNLIKTDHTVITKEFPKKYELGLEKFYPINNDRNNTIYNKYHDTAKFLHNKYIFGGRLAEYKYYDMHQIIGSAITAYEKQ